MPAKDGPRAPRPDKKAPQVERSELIDRVRAQLEQNIASRADPRNRVRLPGVRILGQGDTRTVAAYATLRRRLWRMDYLIVEKRYGTWRAAYEITDLDDQLNERIARTAHEIAARLITWECTLDEDRNLVFPSRAQIEQIQMYAEAEALEKVTKRDNARLVKKRKRPRSNPRGVPADQHMTISADNLRKYYFRWKRGELVF